MKQVIKEEGLNVPIKMWADNIEDSAMEQARHLASLPFAFHHIALMADAHTGFGMPIGGVLATKGYVVFNAVGGDIGCGMNAVPTNIDIKDMAYPIVQDIFKNLKARVPVGFSSHDKPSPDRTEMLEKELMPYSELIQPEIPKAVQQLGTLGGGNHFIELQAGSDGKVWLMLHSGSRHLGQVVNTYYNNLAKAVNKVFYSSIPKEWDLAFLPYDFTDGKGDPVAEYYLLDMDTAKDYAFLNRKVMMSEFQQAVRDSHAFPDVEFGDMINIPHNFVELETHFGEQVYVHRKGATQAYEGQLGIIPGSQGTSSYIVRGKGNPDSFMSCSHGAGRVLSRNRAVATLKLSEQQKIMEGIVHDITNQKALDEAPGAYKDIEQVMANQTDLVDIVVKLKPLGVLKG